MGEGICESEIEELVPEWGWRREIKGTDKLIPETRWSITEGVISYIFREDDVGGRAKLTTDEERVTAKTLNRDEIMKVWRLDGCENV